MEHSIPGFISVNQLRFISMILNQILPYHYTSRVLKRGPKNRKSPNQRRDQKQARFTPSSPCLRTAFLYCRNWWNPTTRRELIGTETNEPCVRPGRIMFLLKPDGGQDRGHCSDEIVIIARVIIPDSLVSFQNNCPRLVAWSYATIGDVWITKPNCMSILDHQYTECILKRKGI